MEQTGYHTVEEVEDSPHDDKQQCQMEVTHKGEIGGDAARNEVATGNRIGDMLLEHETLKIKH